MVTTFTLWLDPGWGHILYANISLSLTFIFGTVEILADVFLKKYTISLSVLYAGHMLLFIDRYSEDKVACFDFIDDNIMSR